MLEPHRKIGFIVSHASLKLGVPQAETALELPLPLPLPSSCLGLCMGLEQCAQAGIRCVASEVFSQPLLTPCFQPFITLSTVASWWFALSNQHTIFMPLLCLLSLLKRECHTPQHGNSGMVLGQEMEQTQSFKNHTQESLWKVSFRHLGNDYDKSENMRKRTHVTHYN